MLVITLPMYRHFIKGDIKNTIENRQLTQRPKAPNSINDLGAYAAVLDKYFSDQFGYRKNFVDWANQIKYYVFKEFNSTQISFGKNNFIFFNSHNAKHPNSLIKIVCDENKLNQKNADFILNNISKLLKFYHNKGIIANMAIIPTKSRIYPENLPEMESQWCLNNTPTWLDRNMLKFSEHQVYYPLAQMQRWKNEFQVYLPKHFHWNGKTPYYIAEDMMKTLWNIDPVFDVEAQATVVKADLKRFLSGLELKEKSFKYDYQSQDVKRCRGRNCIDGLNKVYKNIIAFHFTKENFTNRRLLLLTDSFGAGIAEHFIRGFDEVTMIDLNYLKAEERTKFYQTIIKMKKPTHLLHLIHDSGTYNRAVKFKKLLTDLEPSEVKTN